MYRAFRCLGFATAILLLSLPLIAQQSKQELTPPAPVPPQITAAKKIFISNGGGERPEALGEAEVDGGPDLHYNEFYAAIKSWGRYVLVSSPADADLVFDIRCKFTAAKDESLRFPAPVLGQLQLIIIDPKTHVRLWTIKEYVRGSGRLENRDKNFDLAMDTVVTRLKTVAGGTEGSSGK